MKASRELTILLKCIVMFEYIDYKRIMNVDED